MILKLFFLILLIVFLVVSVPVAYGVGLSSFVGMIFNGGIQWSSFITSAIGGINSFTMLAIPLFLLAGKLMNTGGVTHRLFRFAKVLVGWLPGGLGHVNVVCSVMFAGMSGSAVADAGGLGAIELKAMRDDGYDDDFSCAVTATSSLLGPMIPPSIPMIIYGTLSGASVGALFLAGIIPGVLMAVVMMLLVLIYAIIRKYPRASFPKLRETLSAFKSAILPLLTVVIILVGRFSGFFSATEAAAVAALYALLLSTVIYKEITLRDLKQILLDTVKDTASIGIIIATGALLGSVLVRSMLPQRIAEAISGVVTSQWMLLILINLFLLVVGMFMESTAAMTILVPILLPIVTAWGISPVQFGIVFIMNMSIGTLTPPFGILIFVLSKISGLDVARLVKAYIPWIGIMTIVLLLITFIPQLTLALPIMSGLSV